MHESYYLIDFDSTFIKTESLEELFSHILKKDPQKKEKLQKIQEITDLGMAGELDFAKSLDKRMKLLKATKKDIQDVTAILKKKITSSIERNKLFFKQNSDNIYIISGGFKEIIFEVVKKFGISESHILANEFTYDNQENIIGYDHQNPCSQTGGKATAVKLLNLNKNRIVIGDGITDYQIKQKGYAEKFYAFTENVSRKAVIEVADKELKSFDEFLFDQKLPGAISYPKSKIKVLLLENIDQEAFKRFSREGYQVTQIKKALDEDELINQIQDISLLGIRSKTRISKKVLDKARNLMAVGAFCIGTDQMQLTALSQAGVAAFNAPYQNTRSVVELAIGEIIMLSRGIFSKNKQLHEGIWDKSAADSHEIRGKTLGIIGYGNIGSQISVLAEGLGMKVIYFDQVEKLPLGNAQKVSSLSELLKQSDFITVHVSGENKNNNLISEKEFIQMKDGVIFLNLSRGKIVDIKALEKYLKLGKIRGAGIDVFPDEPKSREDPFLSVLQNRENVILTPHIAGSTEEAQRNIADFVSHKLVDFINTGNTYLSVNLPNIQLPPMGNSHRLLHMHHNNPGILAQINEIFAKEKINIDGQYLKTNEQIGYVITDVAKKYNQSMIKQLKEITGTIRVRALY